MSEKFHIEKNTVQETLVIPLFARAECTKAYPNLFQDPYSLELIDQLDYDFSGLENKGQSMMARFGYLEVAMRQTDLQWEIKDYLKEHPNAAVVNLGCGLDMTGRNVDNGTCKLYNLDLPDVMAVRNELIPAGEREVNIAADLTDHDAWFDQIDASDGAVFFAAGVFYYIHTDDAISLFDALAEKFPGGKICFDHANSKACKMMLKTWIKEAGIQDVGVFFHVDDVQKDIQDKVSAKCKVSHKGYMLGYNDLKDPSVSGFFRFLSKVGDGYMNMQIYRIDFGE